MGAAAVLAVIEVIGKVVGAINSIVDFVKKADDFFNGRSDWDQVREIVSAQIENRDEILQVSGEILDAVAQLDRRIFLEHIADKLGDSDQAVLALDTWKRTSDAGQKAIALNESAGALADVLRYSNNNVYPNGSLVFPLIEILVIRLLVLKEADPDFVRSTISRHPIEEAVQLIRSTADSIEAAILQANVIRDDHAFITRVRTLPRDEGGGRETIKVLSLSVSYRNLDGTVTFERQGEFGPEDGDPNVIIAQAGAAAAAARQRGLAHDLDRARLTVLRDAANTAERCVLVAEARWVAATFFKRLPTHLETAYFVARRQRAGFEEVALTAGEHVSLDRDALGTLVTELRGRKVARDVVESLWNVAEVFGKRAVLRLLMDNPPASPAEPPRPPADEQS
jgi:hypothetical protein